jgi:hypothetical protein
VAAPAQRPEIQDFHAPEKPPFRGCENPQKRSNAFSGQATAIHRLYRE